MSIALFPLYPALFNSRLFGNLAPEGQCDNHAVITFATRGRTAGAGLLSVVTKTTLEPREASSLSLRMEIASLRSQ
jgi:hypothetical protein